MGRTLTNTMINLQMSSVVEEALFQVCTVLLHRSGMGI